MGKYGLKEHIEGLEGIKTSSHGHGRCFWQSAVINQIVTFVYLRQLTTTAPLEPSCMQKQAFYSFADTCG